MSTSFLPRLLLAVVVAVASIQGGWPQSAFAQSSGGYSAPRGGYAAPQASRRPPVSSSGGYGGGYSRPSVGGGSSGFSGSSSGGDRAVSRQSSADALRQYRAPPPAAATPPASSNYAYGSSGSGLGSNYDTRRPSAGPWGAPGGTYPQYDRRAPSYAVPPPPPSYGWAQPGRGFGVWDGLMLWGLLNSLNNSNNARFFYNNQNDPGYLQWRGDADRTAQQDPAVRARLDELDRQMAQLQGQPRTPGAAPSTKPPPLAPESSGGGGALLLILLLVGGVVIFLWLWRRRVSHAGGAAQGAPAALRGSAQTRFRVGMTFPADPSAMLLAAGATKVRGLDSGGMISVDAIGVLMDGRIPLNRLYLPGRDSFFQIHLGPDGQPDECRYFSHIDEVTPSSNAEWGAWLDPAQGMIGWPRFQTKDGKLYDRIWAPGSTRVPPRETTETIEDLKGTSTRKLSSMLYGAPTGLAVPAPQTEYILVSAVEAGGEAFVEIYAGIDINPASLSLPSVKLE